MSYINADTREVKKKKNNSNGTSEEQIQPSPTERPDFQHRPITTAEGTLSVLTGLNSRQEERASVERAGGGA